MHHHQQQRRPSRHVAASPAAVVPLASSTPSDRQLKTQQQLTALILSQVYARAERLRLPSSNASPVTLIELIEASYAVFERYDVRPPASAEYHRCLLSLSIDPERDWKKKIRVFTTNHQLRIQRLYRFGNDTVGGSSSASPATAVSVTSKARPDESSRQRRRQRALTSDSHSSAFHGSVAAVATVKPVALTTPRAASARLSLANRADPRPSLSPLSSVSPHEHWKPRRDQFSDMLAFQPEKGDRRHSGSNALRQQLLKENVMRNAEEAPSSSSPSTSHSGKSERLWENRFTGTQPSILKPKRLEHRSYNETTEELTLPDRHFSEQDDEGRASTEKLQNLVDRQLVVRRAHHQSQPPNLSMSSSDAKFKLLATSFENWKAIHALNRIVKQRKSHEMRLRQAATPPICTHALFRWVALTLPEVHAFVTECQALPTTVLRRISTVLNSEKLSVMRFFTQKLAKWKLRSIFDQWRADTTRKRLFMKQVRLQRRAEALDTAFMCLQRWVLYREMRQCCYKKSSWIAQRHDRGCMRKSLDRWRQCLYVTRSWSGSVRHHTTRLLRRVVTSWKLSIGMSRSVNQLYFKAATRRVVGQWKQVVANQRELCRKALTADSHFQHHLVLHSWCQWRSHTQQARKLGLKLAFYHRKHSKRDKARVFENWKSVLVANQALRYMKTQFQAWKGRRLVAMVFEEWAKWCERKRVNTLAVIDAIERLQDKRVTTVFALWRSHFRHSQGHDSGIMTQIQRIEKRGLWRRWRRATQMRQVAYALVSAYNSHLLSEVLRLWTKFTRRKLRNGDILVNLYHQRVSRTLRACWRVFQTHLEAKQALRSSAAKLTFQKAMAKTSDHFQRWRNFVEMRLTFNHKSSEVSQRLVYRGALNRAWTKWRSRFQERSLSQLVGCLVQSLHRRRFFRNWQRFCLYKQQKRANLARVVKKLEQRRLMRAISRWKAVLRAKKMLSVRHQRCAQVQKAARLDKCWSTWRRAFLDSRKQQIQVADVISRWQNQRLQSCFLQWKTRWRLRKDHRRLITNMLVVSKEKACGFCFTAWKKLSTVKTRRRIATQDTTEALAFKKLHRALMNWHGRASSSTKRAQTLQKCLGLWRQTRLEAHFRQWQAFYRMAKRLAILSKAAKAHRHRHLQAILLSKWRQWNMMRASECTAFQQRCHEIERARLAKTIAKLHQLAIKARQLKRIQSIVTLLSLHGTLTTSFSQWKRHITDQHRRRSQHRVNVGKLRTFRLQRVVNKWEQRLRLRKIFQCMLCKAVAFSTSVILQQMFTAWKLFIERCHFYRNLEQKALVFQVFSMLPRHFQRWHNVAASKKRKRTLMMRASGLLSHQRESRALMAWKCFARDVKQARIALGKWENYLLSHCFTKLVRFRVSCNAERRTFDRANNFYRRRLAVKTLRAWRKAARCSRLLRHFAKLWGAHHSRQSFRLWTRFVRVKKSSRQLLSKIRNALVLKAFNSWKARIEHETRQVQRIQLRFALLWKADLVAKAWVSWMAFARLSLRLKTRQRQQQCKSMRSSFQTWQQFAVERRALKNRARQLVGCSSTRLVRSFWAYWRWRQQLRCYVARIGQAALSKRQGVHLQMIVYCWKMFTRRSTEIKKRGALKQQKLMQIVFHCGWREFVALKRDEKCQRHQLEQLHSAFLTEWLAHEVEDRLMKISICEDVKRVSYLKRLVAQAWQAWLGFHERKRQQRVQVLKLQRAMTIAEASSSLHNEQAHRKSLKRMIVRWTKLQLAQTFETWASMAHDQRKERELTLRALENWQLTQTKAVFMLWRTTIQHNKMENLVTKLSRSQTTRRCWRKWRNFMKSALQSKISSLKATNWWSQRVSRLHFTAWSRLAIQSKLQRGFVLQLFTLSRLKLIRALLVNWKAFAVAKRTKRLGVTVAQAAYETRVTRSAWRTWRAFTCLMKHHRQQLQASTERLQVLLLCSAFRGWRDWANQRHKLTAIVGTLSTKCSTKTVALVLHSWHAHTVTKLRLQLTASYISTFGAFRRGLRGLKAFVNSSKRKNTAIQKAKLFLAMMRGQRVANSFVVWRQFTSKSRKKRLAKRHFEATKLLPKAWHAWKCFVQVRKCSVERMMKATRAWKNAFVRKVWHALLLHHRLKTRTRETLAQAEAHFTTRSLHSAVREWRQIASHSKHIQVVDLQLITQWRLRTVYRCFSSWNLASRSSREVRRCHLVVMETSQALLRLEMWGLWRKLFVTQRTGKCKKVQRCWSRWLEFCDSKRSLVKFQQAIEATYFKSIQRRLLTQWTRFVMENKLRKTMQLLSTGFASTQLAKRGFEAWWKAVARSRVHKHKISCVLLRMKYHRQIVVFRALRTFTNAQQHKRRLVERASGSYNNKLLFGSLRGWKHNVETTKSHREKLRCYLNLLQHSVQRKSFASWLDFTVTRQQLRLKTIKALALRSHLSSRLVWAALMQHTHKCKQARLATQFCDSHIAKRLFTCWRRFVMLCKVEAMLGASNKRQVELCFVSWRKHVALSRCVRDFQHKAQVKRHADQVRGCLSAWCHWSGVQRRFRQLLCSAANGNHVRFRFLLWQQFSSHRRRLKRMLIVPLAQSQGVESPSTLLGNDEISCLTTELLDEDGQVSSGKPITTEEDELLGSIATALSRKARFFQRFELEWTLETSWQRWRHVFHAHLFFRMRKLHAHFLTWQRFSEQRQRVRWVVQRFALRRRECLTTSVFQSWKRVVQSVKQLQQQRRRDRELWTIVSTEMARKERKCLKSHWQAWQFYAEEKRHLQASVAMYHRARLVTKFWLVWTHDFLRVVRQVRTRIQAQRAYMAKFYKRRALAKLHSHQQWTKRARLVLEYFTNRTYDRMLPQILSHWRALLRKAKRVKRLSALMQWRWLVRAFHTWSDWQCAQRQLKGQVVRLMTRNRHVRLDGIWQRWRQFVSMRLAKVDILTKCERHYLATRLHKRWHQRLLDRRALRLLTMQASEVLEGLKMRKSVRRWRNFASNMRLRRLYRTFCLRKHLERWRWNVRCTVASRFEHFLLRARVKKMLASWRETTTKFQYLRQLCAEMNCELDTRRMRVVWTCWLVLVGKRRRNLEARHQFELRLRTKMLKTWYQSTQCAKSAWEDQLELAEIYFDTALRRKSWNRWRTVFQKQKKKRFSLLACMVKLTSLSKRRVVEVIWKLWREWADRERNIRALQYDFECKLQTRMLSVWQKWVAHKRQTRQRLAQAERYHSSRLVSVTFFYWQNYALAWKDVTDANRQQQPLEIDCTRVHNSRSAQPSRALTRSGDVGDAEAGGEEDQKDDERRSRPLSPVMKRLRQRNQHLEASTLRNASLGNEFFTPSFSEAAELSMDVKKRLMVLRKWKPHQKSLQPPQ